jgi:putative ABC transport system permease protein
MMDSLLQDLKLALRALVRNPGFASLSVVTLAVGIGANATLFTWMNAVLLEPLPGTRAPLQLTEVLGTSRSEAHISMSYPDYRDLRDGSRSFSGVVAANEQPASLAIDGEPERIWTQIVSGNFFEVLGVPAYLGRTLRPEDDQVPGRDAVIVLGHGLWQRRFGSDAGVVGRKVKLNGHAFTVVGVAPPEFRGSIIGLTFEAWMPMAMQQALVPGGDRLQSRGQRWLDVLARRAPGVTIGQARAELDAKATQLGRDFPATNEGVGLAAYGIDQSPRGAVKALSPVFAVLGVAVGLILLIACANVANLLLARAAGRRREIALRQALGASRSRLVRLLLTESAVLALLAGTLGVLLAYWSAGLLLAFVPAADFPVGLELGVDRRALAFASLLTVLTAVVFGLAPALRGSRPDLVDSLKESGAGSVGGRGRAPFRHGLVVTQVALSLVLLTSAGLLLRSLGALRSLDPGFDGRNVLLGSLDLFGNGYGPERGRRFVRELLTATRALPGVESATVARRVPLSFGGTSSRGIVVEGYAPPPKESAWAVYNQVGPSYCATLRIPLVAGRDLTDADDERAPRVLLVGETMARRYWPGGDAVGGRLRLDDTWHTVVGVAKDIRYRRFDEKPEPVMYLPLLQSWSDAFTLHVRARRDAASLAPAVRSVAAALDAALPLYAVRTLEESMKAASVGQRLAGSLVSAFGVVALFLAAVGLYGVLQNAVAERMNEIGIRMALGGARPHILGLVLHPALRLAGLGIGLGLLGSAGLARVMATLLFGVSPLDPFTLASVALLMLLVSLAATALPALRATRVDPALALRKE